VVDCDSGWVSPRDLADSVAREYASAFGQTPAGVWFAPGRVNLIGEHTDYNDGFVLPFALSSGVAVAAGRLGSGVTVRSRQCDGAVVTVPVDGLTPAAVDGWAAYPLGMVWSLTQAGYRPGSTTIAIDADLAAGAGLASSAALECAVGLAVADLHGLPVVAAELIRLASKAENEFAGAPTGIMDQSAVLLCQAGHALLLDCRSGASDDVPLEPGAAGLALLVIDTGVRHALTDGRYAQRRRSCEAAAHALGVGSLRDLPDGAGDVAGLADPELQRRARHVISENHRVLAVADLLRRGDLAAVGPLLTESHASLRDDFEVSWPQADVAVETAIAAGALGARMTGGGFGGAVIALAPATEVANVRMALAAAYSRRRWSPPMTKPAVPSHGARRLR
jgi:galactokinase